MLEEAAIHEYLSSGWREGTSSGRAEKAVDSFRAGYFNSFFPLSFSLFLFFVLKTI